MTLYLIGARARYSNELQAIVKDCGLPAGVRIDNLTVEEAEGVAAPRLLSDLIDHDGDYLLCPSPPGIRAQLAGEIAHIPVVARPPLIHPSSSVANDAQIDSGSSVNRLVSVGVDVKIGKHCQINRSVSIGHDCHIRDFVTIGPGAVIASGVEICAGVFVGAGAVILPGRHLGRNSVVGAGAVVTRDVPERAIVFGNPARVISVSEAGYQGFSV